MLFGVPYLISSFISLKSDVLVHWFLLIGHEADSKTIPVRHSIYSHPYSTDRHPLVTKFERHPVSSADPPPYWHILPCPLLSLRREEIEYATVRETNFSC
jgi:hypothetical protein